MAFTGSHYHKGRFYCKSCEGICPFWLWYDLYFFRSQILQDGGRGSYVAAKDCFPVTTLKRFNRNEKNERMFTFFVNGYVNILARFKDNSIFLISWYLIARLVWWWFTKTLLSQVDTSCVVPLHYWFTWSCQTCSIETRVNDLNTVVKCSHVVSANSLSAGEYLGMLRMNGNDKYLMTVVNDYIKLMTKPEKILYYEFLLCSVMVVE